MILTAEIVREFLDYETRTGILKWRHRGRKWFATLHEFRRWNTRYADSEAGHISVDAKTGRRVRRIRINKRHHLAHRLAWLYITGEWPPMDLDHADLDPLNNRWRNLRLATRSQNIANGHCRANNKMGVKGVSFHKETGMYGARIRVTGVQRSLGHFKAAEEAHAAYCVAAAKAFGEFARFV